MSERLPDNTKNKKNKTQEEKLAQDRAKLAEGQTKPLPTEGQSAEQKEAEANVAKVLSAKARREEEIKKRLEELKAAQEEAAKLKKELAEAQKAEAEEKKAVLDKLDEEIKALEEKVAEIPLVQQLAAKKEERAKLGPLPKVGKTGVPRAPRDPNAPKGEAMYGMERSRDLPWCEKKAMLFATLRDGGATSPTTAMSTGEVAEASGLVARDVRHYSYHAKAGGLVDVSSVEGKVGHCFSLTEAGLKELAAH